MYVGLLTKHRTSADRRTDAVYSRRCLGSRPPSANMRMNGWQRSALIALIGTALITVILALLNVAGLVSIIIVFALFFVAIQFVRQRSP
jgi:hypothetical protein